MSTVARAAALAALLVAACAWAQPARATHTPTFDATLDGQYVRVHYASDPEFSPEDWVRTQDAGTLAAVADRAYRTLSTTWGYGAWVPDADGRIDIWVYDIHPDGVGGLAWPQLPPGWVSGPQRTGYIHIDREWVLDELVVAHEIYHLLQFKHSASTMSWLNEATADWAGLRFTGFPAYGLSLYSSPDYSLSCVGTPCGEDPYDQGGYARWVFVEYLSERFGADFVRTIFPTAAALGASASGDVMVLENMLAARGTNLSAVYGDFAVAMLTGNFTISALKGRLPTPHSTTYTGTASASLPGQYVAVNRLATRYLSFKRGTSSPPTVESCRAATLNISVTMPPLTSTAPTFYWTGGGSASTLALAGGLASISVPWDTCNSTAQGLLALPNTSTTDDAQEFLVSASIAVDQTKDTTPKSPPASPTKPPNPPLDGRATVAAPTANGAPGLTLHAPALERVTTRQRALVVVLNATGPGRVAASLGGRGLGTFALRSGYNSIRLALPRGLRAGRVNLTLTSLSPTGERGGSVTHALRVVGTRVVQRKR